MSRKDVEEVLIGNALQKLIAEKDKIGWFGIQLGSASGPFELHLCKKGLKVKEIMAPSWTWRALTNPCEVLNVLILIYHLNHKELEKQLQRLQEDPWLEKMWNRLLHLLN